MNWYLVVSIFVILIVVVSVFIIYRPKKSTVQFIQHGSGLFNEPSQNRPNISNYFRSRQTDPRWHDRWVSDRDAHLNSLKNSDLPIIMRTVDEIINYRTTNEIISNWQNELEAIRNRYIANSLTENDKLTLDNIFIYLQDDPKMSGNQIIQYKMEKYNTIKLQEQRNREHAEERQRRGFRPTLSVELPDSDTDNS
jgi:hypothetical protein